MTKPANHLVCDPCTKYYELKWSMVRKGGKLLRFLMKQLLTSSVQMIWSKSRIPVCSTSISKWQLSSEEGVGFTLQLLSCPTIEGSLLTLGCIPVQAIGQLGPTMCPLQGGLTSTVISMWYVSHAIFFWCGYYFREFLKHTGRWAHIWQPYFSWLYTWISILWSQV